MPPGIIASGTYRPENTSWDTLASSPNQQLAALFVWKEIRKVFFKEFDQPKKPELNRLAVEVRDYPVVSVPFPLPAQSQQAAF